MHNTARGEVPVGGHSPPFVTGKEALLAFLISFSLCLVQVLLTFEQLPLY